MLYADNDSEFEKMINAISKIWSLNFTVLQPLVLNVVTLESLLPLLKRLAEMEDLFKVTEKGARKLFLRLKLFFPFLVATYIILQI